MNTYILPENYSYSINILPVEINKNNIVYSAGGGKIFKNALKSDLGTDGLQSFGGNEAISGSEDLKYKVCNSIDVINKTVKIEQPKITRGLFKKIDNEYVWNEFFSTPLGYFEKINSSNVDNNQINLLSNRLYIRFTERNVVPKQGDYLVFQKVKSNLDKVEDIKTGMFTDGFSNFPVIKNTSTYQFKITNISFSTFTDTSVKYTITLDKSIQIANGEEYAVILLNRGNVALGKGLSEEIFEQIEVHTDQLLGDPYFNTSLSKPFGRKNYLNYNNGEYMGIKNLIPEGIIKNNAPFIVFDIDKDIQDKFLNKEGTISIEFPTVLIQDNEIDNNPFNEVKLVNYGETLNDNNIGEYGGLFLSTTKKRFGWVFYDLRTIIIDDVEMIFALSYNSNRNYTLPKPILFKSGNNVPMSTSNISLSIVDVQLSNNNDAIIVVSGNHNFTDGTPIMISNVKTRIPGTNIIKNSDLNGLRFVGTIGGDPTKNRDRFKVFKNASKTSSINTNETFVQLGLGQSGTVKGEVLQYKYFLTYKTKNSTYDSILPYGELINFNFENNGIVDNEDENSIVSIKIPKFTYLNQGYEINKIDFIIGEWATDDDNNPSKITGIKNVYVIDKNIIPEVNSETICVISKLELNQTKENPNNVYSLTNVLNDNIKKGHYTLLENNDDTFCTAQGKWLIGNITYQTQVDKYRSMIKINVKANEWNTTMNPTYDVTNKFLNEKYISEIALCSKNDDSDTPLIYAKISPAIKKPNNLDIIISLSIDW